MSETYNCNEVIKTCIYSSRFNQGESAKFCDYLCRTGSRRGCKATECDKYIPKNGVKIDNKVSLQYSDLEKRPDNASVFRNRKSKALQAARDFNYGAGVIRELRNAKTEFEIDRIMKTARHAKFRD